MQLHVSLLASQLRNSKWTTETKLSEACGKPAFFSRLLQVLNEYLQSLLSNPFEVVMKDTVALTKQGFAAAQILSQLHDLLEQTPDEKVAYLLL